MIVIEHPDRFELITQPDHARLAADVIEVWRADALPTRRTRDILLFATREHDRGWRPVDAAPPVDPASGRPVDFVGAPDAIKQEVWPRAVAELGDASPYGAALVAQHALTVYGQSREAASWSAFFDRLTTERDGWLARSGEEVAQLELDYRLLRLADLISLAFCNGWTEPREHAGYRLKLTGSTLTIDPDPFDGIRVPLHVARRTIPNRKYSSSGELLSALQSAPVSSLDGVCEGA